MIYILLIVVLLLIFIPYGMYSGDSKSYFSPIISQYYCKLFHKHVGNKMIKEGNKYTCVHCGHWFVLAKFKIL